MGNEKRLIDVDKAKKDFNLHFGGVSHAVIANMILDEQPTVDAVEVVRCKDCRHYGDSPCDNGYMMCDRWGEWIYPNDDDFCSCGERKDDEN